MRRLKPLYFLLIIASAIVVELFVMSSSQRTYKYPAEPQPIVKREQVTTPLERCILYRLRLLPVLSTSALALNLRLLSDYLELHDVITSLRPISVKAEVMAYKMLSPQSYLLRAGAHQGIERLDPVIHGERLVGVIVRVGVDYSVMLTLASPELYVSVTTLDATTCELRGFGYIRGNGSDIRIENFQPESAIRDGVLVVSSGQGLFPAGLVVGEVRDGKITPVSLPPNPRLQICEKRLPLSALPDSLRSLLAP